MANNQHQSNTDAPWYAEVIIPLALPLNYTWTIPVHLLPEAKVGCRVEVNLGKQKKYAGIIKRIHQQAPAFFEAKPILNILDVEPVVYEQQLLLWEWMASYYMCSEGEVMAAALPAHFKLSSETVLIFNEEVGDNFSNLDNDEFLVAEALLLRKELRLVEVQKILDATHVYPVINRLIKKRVCFVWEALKETYSPRKETVILLAPAFREEEALEKLLSEDKALQRAAKQTELLLSYLHFQKTEGRIEKQSLLKKANATEAQLKGLIDKGILIANKVSVDRIASLPKHVQLNFTLSPSQQNALEAVKNSLQEKNITLLHGVTGSGKTEIYIQLIADCIQNGKQALYMLPEIALTSQTIRRLQQYFGGHIAVYHSKFSQSERVEIWNKVKSGELKVVLGARSALFLPFSNLGLIVCDEEHDTSYKQMEPAPRYHARDTAIYLASAGAGIKIVLGSATPSLESYQNARTGKYGLVELTQRYGNLQMPVIEIVDTRRFRGRQYADTIIFPPLLDKIRQTLESSKQTILFQNRRGYTPYQRCNTCGWIPQCKYCDVSLTYHKFDHKLVCHYCGTQYPVAVTCPACGSHDFVQKKFGTEKIEENLKELLPEAKIGRMDIDAMRGKHSHDKLIQQFEQQKLDILVGTQMVVKGLDFAHVNLVGILDADGILSFSDFRVNERAFQLIEQVSGRAGRKNDEGRVIIQTTQPTHPILLQVQQHDYKSMFQMELHNRQQFQYPPYNRIIKITCKNKIKELAHDAAAFLKNTLQDSYGEYIIGPSEPVVNRIRNQYLMNMLIKLPKNAALIKQCKETVLYAIALMRQEKRFKSVSVIPDVDPN